MFWMLHSAVASHEPWQRMVSGCSQCSATDALDASWMSTSVGHNRTEFQKNTDQLCKLATRPTSSSEENWNVSNTDKTPHQRGERPKQQPWCTQTHFRLDSQERTGWQTTKVNWKRLHWSSPFQKCVQQWSQLWEICCLRCLERRREGWSFQQKDWKILEECNKGWHGKLKHGKLNCRKHESHPP